MTSCIGVFMVTTGFLSEKPRSGNPCGAWAAADYRGIRGFISTAEKFFKNNHPDERDHQSHQKNIFSDRKNHENPEYPVFAISPGKVDASPRSG